MPYIELREFLYAKELDCFANGTTHMYNERHGSGVSLFISANLVVVFGLSNGCHNLTKAYESRDIPQNSNDTMLDPG